MKRLRFGDSGSTRKSQLTVDPGLPGRRGARARGSNGPARPPLPGSGEPSGGAPECPRRGAPTPGGRSPRCEGRSPRGSRATGSCRSRRGRRRSARPRARRRSAAASISIPCVQLQRGRRHEIVAGIVASGRLLAEPPVASRAREEGGEKSRSPSPSARQKSGRDVARRRFARRPSTRAARSRSCARSMK